MDPNRIKHHIRSYYTGLFAKGRTAPAALPIRSGKSLAAELEYPNDFLELIPDELWDLFAPCGNPLPHLLCACGQKVLNLGCGVGIDSLALTLFCPGTHVVGLDVVCDILHRAQRWCRTAKLLQTLPSWVCGDGEVLPFRGQSFDAVLMNGVFNLFPNKHILLKELHRVLRPHGTLIMADLAAAAPLPEYFAGEPDAWAWCMSGALTTAQLLDLLQQSAFDGITLNREENADMFVRVMVVCRRAEGELRRST
jgi:arsenite methyltransferase